MPIRLAIVDDYEVVVRGLAEMLRPHAPDLEVVSVSATPLDQEIDIALIDPSARTHDDGGGRPGLDALLADPRVGKVVVYSWSTDRAQAEDALARGAAACLSKTISAADLVHALRQVEAGGKVASVLPEAPAPDPAGVTWPGREEGLTARESEVIALITQGLSNQEIAERASLSINSVKSYIRTSYRKMGVTSRTNAVLWGLDHGFSPERVRVTE